MRQTAAAAGLHLWPQLQLLCCWHQQWLPLQIATAAIALRSRVGVAYTGVYLLYSAALLQRPAFAISDMRYEAHKEAHEHQHIVSKALWLIPSNIFCRLGISCRWDRRDAAIQQTMPRSTLPSNRTSQLIDTANLSVSLLCTMCYIHSEHHRSAHMTEYVWPHRHQTTGCASCCSCSPGCQAFCQLCADSIL